MKLEQRKKGATFMALFLCFTTTHIQSSESHYCRMNNLEMIKNGSIQRGIFGKNDYPPLQSLNPPIEQEKPKNTVKICKTNGGSWRSLNVILKEEGKTILNLKKMNFHHENYERCYIVARTKTDFLDTEPDRCHIYWTTITEKNKTIKILEVRQLVVFTLVKKNQQLKRIECLGKKLFFK